MYICFYSPKWAVEAFLRADSWDVGARYEAPIDINAGNAAEEGVFGFILYFCLYSNKFKKDNNKTKKERTVRWALGFFFGTEIQDISASSSSSVIVTL